MEMEIEIKKEKKPRFLTSKMPTIANANQMNDLRSYSRHWLGEFIDIYQSEECLWQPTHPDYSNHTVRNKAYDKMVEKLKEVEPHPDRAMVVRKINSLRSAFRREFRKSNMKANYETRLWYYEKLLFIADQNPKRLVGCSSDRNMKIKRSLPLHFDDEESMEFETEEQIIETHQESDNHSTNENVNSLSVSNTECVIVKSEDQNRHAQQQQQLHLQHQQVQNQTHQGTALKVLEITSLDSNAQREIQHAVTSIEQLQQQGGQNNSAGQLTQIHQQVPTIQISREHLQPLFGNSATFSTTHRQEDEYDAIGINVASKLRVMNPTQRIIAEKLISDVLFNGQLDNLSINSTLTQ